MEPQARANQLLPQIASFIGIDLGARIIEELVFNEGAELRSPIVICAGNNLPREVRMTSSSARVKGAMRPLELGTSGFRIVNANPGADIRLESSKRESRDEVPHKRACINPGSQVALSQYITKRIPQGEVSAACEAVVKEVAFNGRTKHACAKDVTEFDATKETDVVFRADSKSVSEIIRKSSVPAAVLIDVRPHVNRSIETEPVKFGRRRSDLLVCDGLAGLQGNGEKSNQD